MQWLSNLKGPVRAENGPMGANSKHLYCDDTAQSYVLSQIFWVELNFVVCLWVSRGVVSSDSGAVTARSVNKAKHARVEKTVVYHSENTRPSSELWAELSCAVCLTPLREWLIKDNNWVYVNLMWWATCWYTTLWFACLHVKICESCFTSDSSVMTINGPPLAVAANTYGYCHC